MHRRAGGDRCLSAAIKAFMQTRSTVQRNLATAPIRLRKALCIQSYLSQRDKPFPAASRILITEYREIFNSTDPQQPSAGLRSDQTTQCPCGPMSPATIWHCPALVGPMAAIECACRGSRELAGNGCPRQFVGGVCGLEASHFHQNRADAASAFDANSCGRNLRGCASYQSSLKNLQASPHGERIAEEVSPAVAQARRRCRRSSAPSSPKQGLCAGARICYM